MAAAMVALFGAASLSAPANAAAGSDTLAANETLYGAQNQSLFSRSPAATG